MAGLFALAFLAALVGVFKPYINGVKRSHFGIAAFVAFVLVGITSPKEPSPAKTSQVASISSSETKPDQVIAETGKAEAAKPEDASEWRYQTQKDEMRGSEEKLATVDATAPIKLDFPYGEQTGRILVRQSPKFGFDILVGVPSGQVMCNSFQDTYISVKFDDEPIQRYRCMDAADGSDNMVFIQGAKGFLARLRKSKKTVIEADFFQNGRQQMTFNTANLKWE